MVAALTERHREVPYENERTANEGCDDRGGSGKERVPAPRRIDDGAVEVPQVAEPDIGAEVMAEQPPIVVIMESCGNASYCARELTRFGHEVRLIAPQYVRPFVKRQSRGGQKSDLVNRFLAERCG